MLKVGLTKTYCGPSAVQGSVTLYNVVTASLGSCVVMIPFYRKESGSLRSWETPYQSRLRAVLLRQRGLPETGSIESKSTSVCMEGKGTPTLHLGKWGWQLCSLHSQAHGGIRSTRAWQAFIAFLLKPVAQVLQRELE